jgi:hypothetical protein
VPPGLPEERNTDDLFEIANGTRNRRLRQPVFRYGAEDAVVFDDGMKA